MIKLSDFYLTNQVVDILLWSWILLIMIKRVICKGKWLHNFHYYSDVLLLIASMIAITQFSDQLYLAITDIASMHLSPRRTIIWMVFHKFLTGAILIKYKNSQPRLFYNIKEEMKHVYNQVISPFKQTVN